MRSFSASSTHFHIVTSDTPVTVDGFALGEPTGEVECCVCHQSHMNVDEIPHEKGCEQRTVKSEFWQGLAERDV